MRSADARLALVLVLAAQVVNAAERVEAVLEAVGPRRDLEAEVEKVVVRVAVGVTGHARHARTEAAAEDAVDRRLSPQLGFRFAEDSAWPAFSRRTVSSPCWTDKRSASRRRGTAGTRASPLAALAESAPPILPRQTQHPGSDALRRLLTIPLGMNDESRWPQHRCMSSRMLHSAQKPFCRSLHPPKSCIPSSSSAVANARSSCLTGRGVLPGACGSASVAKGEALKVLRGQRCSRARRTDIG